MKKRKMLLAASLLLATFLPSFAEAGNLKKKYINVSKEGEQVTATDLGTAFLTGYTAIPSKFAAIFYDYSMNGKQAYINNPAGAKLEADGTMSFDGSRVTGATITGLNVNTSAGAKTTVEYWMRWNGVSGGMPFLWATGYDNWIAGGYFGINTGQGDVLGVPISVITSEVKDKWAHVAITFVNGVPDATSAELHINGKRQPLSKMSNISQASRTVNSTLLLNPGSYPVPILMKDFRVWNHGRTTQQILDHMNKKLTGTEEGLLVNLASATE